MKRLVGWTPGCFDIVVHNSCVVMKEGSKVFSCVYVCVCGCVLVCLGVSLCVWVCGCVDVGWVWLWFSRVRVLAKMGNEQQLSLYLLYFGLESDAHEPRCSLDTLTFSLCGGCPFPSWSVLGALLKGFEITSGFWMSYYVIVPRKSHDDISSTHASVHLHRSLQRESKSSCLEPFYM